MVTVLNALRCRFVSYSKNNTENMEDENLIELVREYEFLYNINHPKYMDTARKDMAWKEIANQLRQSAVVCKQKWQGLRDAYRRALNKKKRKNGPPSKNVKRWKYESEMSFVAPFFMERKAQDSNTEMSTDKNDSVNVDNCLKIEVLEEIGIKTIDNNKAEENITDKKGVKRKRALSGQSAFAIFMEKILECQSKIDVPRHHDELDSFFLNISNTVKKFEPYQQALLKNKIFTLVSEMEIQQLASCTTTPYACMPSPKSTSCSIIPRSKESNWNDQS